MTAPPEAPSAKPPVTFETRMDGGGGPMTWRPKPPKVPLISTQPYRPKARRRGPVSIVVIAAVAIFAVLGAVAVATILLTR